MGLTKTQKENIEETIIRSIEKKLKTYKPETKHMPFHYRLLGKDRMALFSFIHSLNTTFGTSIFEPVAVTLARFRFPKVERSYKPGEFISEEAQRVIQDIMNKLTVGEISPDKQKEIELIRKVARKGRMNKIKTVKVDVFIQDYQGEIHMFDIKTAKPNISSFREFKRTLLEWIAIVLAKNPNAKVHSYIAIPYNPYEPKPYERWTLKGMLDLDEELKVAEEFWDFLGGVGAYNELLDCFEQAGQKLRPKFDKYFRQFTS